MTKVTYALHLLAILLCAHCYLLLLTFSTKGLRPGQDITGPLSYERGKKQA